MTIEEAKKKGELEKKLRLTHPQTIRLVKLRVKKASDPKEKRYLKELLELSKHRVILIEEYKGICKFLAVARGENILEKDLDEFIGRLAGNVLMEKELSELNSAVRPGI
jgi:DnaJ-domain-containing protein 1